MLERSPATITKFWQQIEGRADSKAISLRKKLLLTQVRAEFTQIYLREPSLSMMALPIDQFETSPIPVAHGKLLWLQMALTTFAAVTATFVPPDQGAMMLVPLAMEPAAAVNLAINHGSTILGNGPLPGSIIVQGNRDVLQPLLLRNGVLLLAAAPFLCGKSSDQIGSGQ